MKACPECHEKVREAARICRFCGHRFGEDERQSAIQARRKATEARRRRGAVGAVATAVLAVALFAGLGAVGGDAGEEQVSERASSPAESTRRAAPNTPPSCSDRTVAQELRRRELLDEDLFVGVQDLTCRDLTGDGIEDAAFVRTSTGNEGTKGWGVLVGRRDGRWDLPLLRADEARVRVETDGSSVVRRQPVLLPGDPNCCPSGGTKVEIYDHNGGTFALARSFTEGGAGSEAPTEGGEQAEGTAIQSGEGPEDATSTADESEDSSLEPCIYGGGGLCTPEENARENEAERICGPGGPEAEARPDLCGG